MAMRILREKKPGNVAIAFKKAHRAHRWYLVVYYPDGTRKHPATWYFTRESARQLRQAVQAHQARLEKD